MKRPRSIFQEEYSRNPNPKKALKMVCASTYLLEDDERKPLGEDAHFIRDEEQAMGVADGVGGWAKHAIDAGEYARALMLNASIAVMQSQPSDLIDPKTVLSEAFAQTRLRGSSTACIVTHSGGFLRAANVGDSGFMVFRRGKLFFRSPTQQKGYNCPYQLGAGAGDSPDCTVQMKIPVTAGDVIVLGTDGLFDNLFARKVEKALASDIWKKKGLGLVGELQNMACFIANSALYKSFDRFCVTPFSVAARRAAKVHSGGKIDDITCIVAKIVEDCS